MSNVISKGYSAAPYLPGAAISPGEQKFLCAIALGQAAGDIAHVSFILRKSECTKAKNHAQKADLFSFFPFRMFVAG
jgi:hypothetical protein